MILAAPLHHMRSTGLDFEYFINHASERKKVWLEVPYEDVESLKPVRGRIIGRKLSKIHILLCRN